MVSMDLVEINESLNEAEEIRKRYRGEGDLLPVSKTVGMGIDLISSICTESLTL
jgi:hypothetical protein